ncbi:ABC transporter ATP-binding protein [Kutzneria albida]|uniref:ABC transporter domain-containing protein n=1 Tax=Kutzneria albida DSM 43870 TaxID=1449976 RepID=W5WIU8_9PSEU|nr:ABC transporter ATP-binding protein [Kutzneria albida]AHI00783.1 hypothetical protein KALB_7425 [Kutzneria albida DSM 43870]
MSLHLDEVLLTYPDGDRRVTALDRVSLHVAPGEFVAVTGPSGSGKSSLLAVAGKLIAPEAGSVRVTGTVGFVFQQANLLPALTALDQLLLVGHIGGRQDRARAQRLLAEVGLTEQVNRRPHQLSGGQRQRVGVARALMGEPSVLLVDEPTSALDHERGRAVVELLRRVTDTHQVATLVVTHDLAHLDLVDRTVTMLDGRLSAAGSAALPRH